MVTFLNVIVAVFRAILMGKQALVLENLVLRQQLGVCLRKVKRTARLKPLDRVFWVLLSRIWDGWKSTLVIPKPDTVIGWHRQGFKLGSKQRKLALTDGCRELQMRANTKKRSTEYKRPTLWDFSSLATIRQHFLHTAGYLTHPQGELTMTMSLSDAARSETTEYLDLETFDVTV